MATAYQVLLDATVRHLTELQREGIRHVEVEPTTLADLKARAQVRPTVGLGSPPASPAPPARRGPGGPSSTASPRAPARPPVAVPPRPVMVTPTPAPLGTPLASLPGDPRAAWENLQARARACVRCPHLVRSRTQVVFGVGNREAELMFVGEAPGADEDRQGEPFVGLAGQLLTKIIVAMGFTRETVYIANILKCRPDVPPGMSGNRPPRPEEMDTCKPYLMEQITLIRPKVIVALGLTAVQGLLGVRTTMGGIRGRWQDFRGTPVMPTFHPAYLLRAEQGPDRGSGEKRKTWEDLLLVLERLERPVTERMRGYFRPPAGASAGENRP